MSFLPIVDRELRVASRRISTFRLRSWTVVTAIVANFLFLTLASVSAGGAQAGQFIFTLLTWYSFGLCLLAGLFLTADCLSEERREGTLGLLFLTNLRGYDVVLGKFIARSLNAFYGLLAILPVLGIPLLVGGVTGAEFWRMNLALMNALFFSLASGLFISVLTVDSQRALGSTLALLIVFTIGIPVAARFMPALQPPNFLSYLTYASPFFPFTLAAKGTGAYWSALLGSNALAWAGLAAASFLLPRRWQDSQPASARWASWFGRGSSNRLRRPRPVGWLDRNPVVWLVGDEPALRRSLWLLVLVWGLVASFLALETSGPRTTFLVPWSRGVGFIMKLLFAVHVCRFFADTRRNGAIELLLCTPVSSAQLVRGQWIAARRIFFFPALVFLLLNFVPVVLQICVLIAGSTGFDAWGESVLRLIFGSVLIFWFGLVLVADAAAIGWFGMWLALSLRKPASAPALTILFVLLLPALASCGSGILDLVADLVFFLWGATRLQQDFRWVLSRQ